MVDAPHVGNRHAARADGTDIEVVVLKAKHLEHRLAQAFGAHGRGLHEQITSVAQHFSASEVQHLRYVATIRNRMMHDIEYNRVENRERFLHACAAIDQAIDAILHRREPQRPPERRRTVAQRVVALRCWQRARLVLLLHDHPQLSNVQAGRQVSLSDQAVRLWRRRWASSDFSLEDKPGRGRKPGCSLLRARTSQGHGL